MDKRRRGQVERSIIREAEKMLASGAGYVDFAARFFGQEGLLRQLWGTDAERREVVKSPLYRRLQADAAVLREREAKGFEGEVERLSGRLTVVVPKSLHAALRAEARREGVSLSELIRVKLGVPYRVSVRLMLAGEGEQEAA